MRIVARRLTASKLLLSLGMLGLSGVVVAGPGPAVASPTASAVPGGDVFDKLTGGLALAMLTAPGTPTTGGQSTASLRVTPEVGVSGLTIAVTTRGPVRFDGPSSQTLLPPGAGQSSTVPIPFVVTGPGAGMVRASVSALDRAGKPLITRAVTLWLATRGSNVFQSTSGSLDAAIRSLSSARGVLPPDVYAAELDRLLGGSAAAKTAIAPAGPAVAQSPGGTVSISGQVRYTDSAGNTHPVRLAPVEIRDAESVGSVLVTTVNTNAAGNFTATVNNDDGTPGEAGRDIFIRVLAMSSGFDIQGSTGTQRIDSSVNNDVADGAVLTVNLTANNVADNNTAFAVHDALVTTVAYAATLAGGALPSIVVDFPTPDSTSYFDGTQLHILQLDRFDWDVTLHEFGHYFMSDQNIEDNPGGNHSSSENLSETPGRNKDLGTRLAWGEGFPTYFGTSLQGIMGTAAFNIPNVGDTRYTDTEDSTLDYDLEGPSGGTGLGEDNELSVQRILWDIFDTPADTGDTRGVALGDSAVFAPLKASATDTLSAGYAALVAGKPASTVANMGCIVTEHAVAPRITAPADNSAAVAGAPPTITWSPQGGGPAFRNDRFIVRFYNATFGTLLVQSAEQATTSFTPTTAQWTSIFGSQGALVNVVVAGRQSSSPPTGPYTSCNVRLTKETVAPICSITQIAIDGLGRKFVQVSARDTSSGIASIQVTTAVNIVTPVTMVPSPLPVGTTDPVVVTAYKAVQGTPAQVAYVITDRAGNQGSCS